MFQIKIALDSENFKLFTEPSVESTSKGTAIKSCSFRNSNVFPVPSTSNSDWDLPVLQMTSGLTKYAVVK